MRKEDEHGGSLTRCEACGTAVPVKYWRARQDLNPRPPGSWVGRQLCRDILQAGTENFRLRV